MSPPGEFMNKNTAESICGQSPIESSLMIRKRLAPGLPVETQTCDAQVFYIK